MAAPVRTGAAAVALDAFAAVGTSVPPVAVLVELVAPCWQALEAMAIPAIRPEVAMVRMMAFKSLAPMLIW